MNGYRIDLSSSIFEGFIEDKLLYVDKTLFIEHFLEETSKVLLIARPRRMGKSLNMNMLDTFLDLKRESAALFKGLKIEGRPCFREHINRYPVIYMDFRFLRAEDYKQALRSLLTSCIDKYLPAGKWSRDVRAFVEDSNNFNSRNLFYVTKNLQEVYGQQAVILIDEYDHVLMDNVGKPEYESIRDYISAVFEVALKGNPYLYRALLTGVLRVSQESMFSKLNNIKVYDVFTPGHFDEDFGLTEDEARSLVPAEKFAEIKDWYNNVHIGNSWMFYIYSVLSYLDAGKLSNYWGQSGTIDLLGNLITPERSLNIAGAVKELGACFAAGIDPRVSLELFFENKYDEYYYSLAIQAGYLTFEQSEDAPEEDGDISERYLIRVPNKELAHVWRIYILRRLVRDPGNEMGRIFAGIGGDMDTFSKALSEFISFKLSFFDAEKSDDPHIVEKIYHVFVFGMIITLGYECSSNREAGYGRYDLLVKAPQWSAAIEFKVAKTEEGLEGAAKEGLKQIYDKKYLAESPKNKPAYAIGVGCYKKRCMVISEPA